MLLRELHEDVSQKQLNDVEAFADRLWGKLGVDVHFTKHFIERLNDERNGKPISATELIRLFKKEYEKYGKVIGQMNDEDTAVFADIVTYVNMPVVMKSTDNAKKLLATTVMRKKDFKSSDQSYQVN
jgi:hypothetical protein